MSSMKGVDVAVDPGVGIGGARGVDTAFAGLVPDVQRHAGLRQLCHRERHDGVEPRRTQTTADHQQAQRAFAARETHGRRFLHDDLGAHRIADHLVAARRREKPWGMR